MKIPECDNELKLLDAYSVVGLGEKKIKLKNYACDNQKCAAYHRLWFRSLETGKAVDPPLIAEQVGKLEKY